MVFAFYPHLFWRPDPNDYNCSSKTQEEWALTGTVSKGLGIYFFSVGIIILILYSFVIYTMSSRVFLTKSCWKIMYFNCYIDCGNILVSSVFTGILFYQGGVFCTWPTMSYVGGGIGLGCWCASCVNCIAIAINRFCTVFNRGQGLFKGFRAYFWMGFAVLLMLFTMFFTRPPIFNSTMGAWFYSPFIKDFHSETKIYVNVVHPIVNCFTAAIISILYFFLCTYLAVASNQMAQTKQRLQRLQKKVFIQSVVVCGSSCAAAYIYVYMQFFPVPAWMIVWASFGYQLCSGIPCLVYLTLNHEIRDKAAHILEESLRNMAEISLIQGKKTREPRGENSRLLTDSERRFTSSSAAVLNVIGQKTTTSSTKRQATEETILSSSNPADLSEDEVIV